MMIHEFNLSSNCNHGYLNNLLVTHAFISEAAFSQKDHIQTHGFHKGEVPIEYITENFKSNLSDHILKNFYLNILFLVFYFMKYARRNYW